MFLSKKGHDFRLPVPEKPKTDVKTLVSSANGATYQIYDIPISGWYYGVVRSAAGVSPYKGTSGVSAHTEALVYLYAGTKVLLWGAGVPATGFPAPTDDWGGTGGTVFSGEGGSGGGGAANSAPIHPYANGGGGAGMLFGYTAKPYFSLKNEESQFEMKPYDIPGIYSVECVYAAILCGGAGAGCSDEGVPRASGGGGGAWGDGGNVLDGYHVNIYTSGNPGPGGDFGKGGNGALWAESPGGNGGWAVLNFTTGEFTYGRGGGARGASNGYARLYKIG